MLKALKHYRVKTTTNPKRIAEWADYFLEREMYSGSGTARTIFPTPSRIHKLAVIPEVGWSMLCKEMSYDRYFTLGTWVRKEYRRMGYGTLMAKAVMKGYDDHFEFGCSADGDWFYPTLRVGEMIS